LHLRSFGLEILKNASKIVFLTPKYFEFTFQNYFPKNLQTDFVKKINVVPNGVNPYWLDNSFKRKSFSKEDKITFLYVGDFSKNKNVHISIQVLNTIYSKNNNIEFVLIGGGGDYDSQIRKLVVQNSNWIKILERTNSLVALKEIYRQADIFLMPSKYETFGLVYIEAMSQGMPVIYSSGQGIDGFFKDGEVGYSVSANNLEEYHNKIQLIIDNYDQISFNCTEKAKKFSWFDISSSYLKLYEQILHSRYFSEENVLLKAKKA
jgi:glycosyltransferase involved in cell wall biosynthesis